MAYSPPSRGGRAPARGAPPRGGSSSNVAAYGIAGGVVALLVVVVVLMSAGKKKKAVEPEPERVPVVIAGPVAPATPEPPKAKPYPPIPDSLIEEAKRLNKEFEGPYKEAQQRWDEATKAREAHDDDLWQKKLADADRLLEGIKDQWNDLIAQIKPGNGYDEEEIASYYFKGSARLVSDAGTLQAKVRKTMRAR